MRQGGRTFVPFLSSCSQSMHFPAFLPIQLSYPDCSSHFQSTPLLEKPKPCAPESCIPAPGWAGPWNTLHFLHCCVLTPCVVIWTHPKLSASHWHPPYTGLPCPSQAWGFLQVPDSDSSKNIHLHIKEIHP